MVIASKIKSSLCAWLLALVVVLGLAENRAWGFFEHPQPAPGSIALATPEATGENYDAWRYDASGYAVAPKSLASGGKWGGGWASSGPASWKAGKPFYDPKNFKWGTQKHLTPAQRAGAEVHELTHLDQFANQPWKVWHAQSKLPGRSISMYRLEKQAYKAQADFLGQSYRAGMPFQSHNMWNALNTDLLYGAGALGAGGTLWYLNSEDSK